MCQTTQNASNAKMTGFVDALIYGQTCPEKYANCNLP